jgi:hypothetical protein
MNQKIKFLRENLQAIIVTIIVLVLGWFLADAFFGLVGNLYHTLDQYLWAFFAGIIAFFTALWLISLCIYILLAIVGFVLGMLTLLLD